MSSGEAKPQDASDVQADMSKDSNADIYENRGTKKIIRVVTVMAYLFSVSFVGILLSAYYLFLWEPPNPRLIERGRLRADPQMQFLIATMPSEKTALKKKGNDFLPETEINRAYKALLGSMTYGAYDGNDPNVNSQDKKQKRLNAMLLKLRHSLVETHAQNRNLSKHEATISGISDNSSIRVEKILNSTKITENSLSGQLHENITEEKTRNNNIDLPAKFTGPVNKLDVENTWTSKAATVRENTTKQEHFNRRSVIDANLIVDQDRNYKKKHNATKLYSVPKSKNMKTKDNIIDHRVLEHNNSFEAEQKFSKIDIKEPTKQNETNDRQLINDNRKNPNDIHTITTSKNAEDLTNRLLSINVTVNSLNSRRNYSSNNENRSSNHIEEMARNEVSTISSSHNSGYIHNNSGFHQPPLDGPIVVTRNSEALKERACSSPYDISRNHKSKVQLPRKMSAHNVMASIGRTLGNRDSKPTAPNEVRFAGDERKDKLYEPKHKQKLVRVLTVVAYVIFVSMAAILLSLYYTFVWNPKDQAVRKQRIDKSDCAKFPPLDSPTNPPINETQIEKMATRFMTIDNKQPKEMDISITQRQRGVWENLTETTDIEETSVELTSASTVQDYRNNSTSTINIDNDDSIT